MQSFKKGQRVWWNDPAGETSGYYRIESDVEKDIEALEEQGYDETLILCDLIILIRNEYGSEAQVYICELEPTDN